MIDFHFECDFELVERIYYADWISRIISSEDDKLGRLNYIFCDDEYLLGINRQYLNHDTYTDIITFPYDDMGGISGDIFISIERVRDNVKEYQVDFDAELKRVMAHGVLHLLGFGDKSEEEADLMRSKENEKIKLFHVEH